MLGDLFVCVCVLSHFSHIQLFATPWTIACHIPLSVGLPRQEYWSGLPFPPLEDLPDLGIKPASLTSSFIGRRIHQTATDPASALKDVLLRGMPT